MQRRHELEHPHFNGNGASAGGGHGHNHGALPRTAQWQTPHRPNGYDRYYRHDAPDLDLIENAFAESFADASDPTSFLRLARIPFEAVDAEGKQLVLLRVECDAAVDVGSVSTRRDGGPMRYSPLPRRMATRRRRLRFIYFDGSVPRSLTLGETRTLTET
jgi:hypothetical protein